MIRRFVLAVLLASVAATRAGAECDWLPMTVNELRASVTPLPVTNVYRAFLPSRPYWNVVAVASNATSGDDYDLTLYQNGSGGAVPVCFTGVLTNSARSHGTDFIVGDFNHNPYATYWARFNCYSGACQGTIHTWLDGGTVMTPNSSPVTVTSAGTGSASDLATVWDVFLYSGQKYYLNFQRSGGLDWHMLLFRNPGGGVYWAGRNDAEIEAAGCTTYVAPATGYYGLVVVNDTRPGTAAGSYSINVTTAPVCACPGTLPDGAGVLTANGPAFDHRLAISPRQSWSAVGLRSNSDWDLFANTLQRQHPNVNCADATLAQSVRVGPGTELVVEDHNSSAAEDTMHVTAATFFGNDQARIEAENGSTTLSGNGLLVARSWNPGDVLDVWDLSLASGKPYRFSLQSNGDRALLFRNPGGSSTPWYGARVDAALEVADTATFVPAASGIYGLVLTHESDAAGSAVLQAGTCSTGPPMARNQLAVFSQNRFSTFTPTAAKWVAAGVVADDDFDAMVMLPGPGPGYPDCYGPPLAGSQQGGAGTDFVVGDFHSMPLGPYGLRFFDFIPDLSHNGYAQWREAATDLTVNGPAVTDSMDLHVLGLHELLLAQGVTYTIHFTPSASANEHVSVLGNPGGGTFWAPKSSALFETNGTGTFTPAFTGTHAFVVWADGVAAGRTLLSVTGPVTAVAGPLPARTRLASLSPNPARGALQLDAELAVGADVVFELLDVTGRAVARRELGARAPGVILQSWDLRASGSPAPGLYFLRMLADGRPVGTRRVTIVP